jgi:hypothetical protein
MNEFLLKRAAIGIRVTVRNRNGERVRGKIVDVVPTTKQVVVEFDPEYVSKWDDPSDHFSIKDVNPDYTPDAMKELMKKWRASTGTSAGPLGPMKHVKSFLTGRSRKRKTRKTRKRI